MHPLHTNLVSEIHAELRRRDLMSEAERARRANAAEPARSITAIARAAVRWGVTVRVIRGGRPATPTSPAAA
jgi:hypothetical protein